MRFSFNLTICSILILCAVLFAQNQTDNRAGFLDDKVYKTGNNSDGLEIGDIDNDGKNELVVGNRNTRDFTIFRRIDGVKDSLAFDYTQKINWGMGIIHIQDMNGDGLKDLIIAHYTDYTSGTPKDNKIGLCLQNATTHKLDAEIQYQFPTGTSSRASGCGDVDSDGKPEFVVANEGSGTSLYVWGWNSSTSKMEVEKTVSGISSTISITVADVTGDGKGDIVCHGSGVKVVPQLADGTLGSTASYSGGGESADVGDVNGDGKNDVVGSNAYSNGIDVWLQTTSGTLQKLASYTCGGYTEDCEVTDLNADGKADAAVASRDLSELYVFLQGTSGLASTAVKYVGVQGKWLNEIAVGDLNGDGYTDVAGSNWGNAGVGGVYPASVSVWFYDAPTGKFNHKEFINKSRIPYNITISKNQIRYNLFENTIISLSITDLLGKTEQIITNQYKPAGKYVLPWNSFKYSSGTYVFTLKANKGADQKRFVLVK